MPGIWNMYRRGRDRLSLLCGRPPLFPRRERGGGPGGGNAGSLSPKRTLHAAGTADEGGRQGVGISRRGERPALRPGARGGLVLRRERRRGEVTMKRFIRSLLLVTSLLL